MGFSAGLVEVTELPSEICEYLHSQIWPESVTENGFFEFENSLTEKVQKECPDFWIPGLDGRVVIYPSAFVNREDQGYRMEELRNRCTDFLVSEEVVYADDVLKFYGVDLSDETYTVRTYQENGVWHYRFHVTSDDDGVIIVPWPAGYKSEVARVEETRYYAWWETVLFRSDNWRSDGFDPDSYRQRHFHTKITTRANSLVGREINNGEMIYVSDCFRYMQNMFLSPLLHRNGALFYSGGF